ncbi:MAG TPA: hypothetical protein VFJ59_08020 [Pseudolabrys sp.]|nr:hypothetical protein [Pseudolabrys sp.]
MAILYFVPQDGQLGQNQKRTGQDIFDIYYWMNSWPHFIDLLRNEKPVHFQYDDSNNTAQLTSVPATFLVDHCASLTGSSKPTNSYNKSSKKIYNQPCAA